MLCFAGELAVVRVLGEVGWQLLTRSGTGSARIGDFRAQAGASVPLTLFVPDPRSTRDGTDPVNTVINSATAKFVASDTGSVITLAGAGAGSSLYVGTIAAVNSPTSVTVSPTMSTMVSGAAPTSRR